MIKNKKSNRLQILTAAVTIIFGLLTVFAGSRVLFGISEPGYTVFLPLLIFNTIMGLIYIATGIMILGSTLKGVFASKMIFMLNLSVLFIILFLYIFGSNQVATDSIIAMVFRTTVWLAIYWVLKKVTSN